MGIKAESRYPAPLATVSEPVLPAFKASTAEEIERARVLYEGTDVSPRDVARLLGIGVNTFYRRVKLWGWRRRRLRVEEVDAMAREIAASEAAMADEALAAFAARVADDRRSAAERARDAVAAQFAAIEASQARIAAAALSAVNAERSARTLLILARTLNELKALEREEAERMERGARRSASSGRGGGEADRLKETAAEEEASRAECKRRLETLRDGWLEQEREGALRGERWRAGIRLDPEPDGPF